MPIIERDPWRTQYFERVACPDNVFIPTDDEFTQGDSSAAMLQIRLRTFLRYPDRDDITEDIAEELNITLE